MSLRLDLLSNAAATGSAQPWPGGFGTFLVNATWSGATVKLQILGPDLATYIDVGTNATLTADGGCNVFLPPGMVRAAVSGGPPSGVYAAVIRQVP